VSNRFVEIVTDIENDRKAQEARKVPRFNERRENVLDVRCEATKGLATERGITFCEAARQIEAEDAMRAALSRAVRSGNVDPRSVIFMESATARAAAEKISYGDALKLVYQESGSTLPLMLKVLVAAIEGGTIVLNQGSDVGVKIGDRFTVQRPGTAVVDPASIGKSGVGGRIIRQMTTRVGELTVREVDALSALATGIPAAQLQVGDICEPIAAG
jgi:hypothetical protein